jgi:HEAT repeat protein
MRNRRVWLALVLMLTLSPVTAWASTVDALVAVIAGNDEKARADARQAFRHESIEAVPRLLPLLAKEDDRVWRAAFNILADFANSVSVPGREADRAAVTTELMTLVAPAQPEAVKIRGLRLLPLVVPDGYEVGPVAALLDSPELREKARAALRDIGTPEARTALRNYLKKADPEFQCAILDALGQLHDTASIAVFKDFTANQEPRLRVAAARALSWTGDPAYLAAVTQVAASADPATRSDAWDARLRLLNSIADKGGNWQLVVNEFQAMLQTDDSLLKQASLAGLGRIGDGSCVAPIFAAIKDADNPTWMIGIAALRSLQGVDVARALVTAYPDLPPNAQLEIIPVLGAKKHALVLPVLIDAAKSTDPAFRSAAFAALGATGLPEAMETLVTAARDGQGADKPAAAAALLDLADALRLENKPKQAGPAYLAALQSAQDKESRSRALTGITLCPVAEAYDLVKKAASDKDLQEPAVQALVGIAGVFAKAKQKDKALEAYQTIQQLNPSMAAAQEVVKGMYALGAKVDLSGALGIVTSWWVVGPFDLGPENQGWNADYLNREPHVNLKSSYPSGDKTVAWKHLLSDDPNGKIDLRANLADRDQCIGYAYTEITVKQDTDAVLRVGADDSEKIWVNGKKVYERFIARGLVVDQDKVSVKLTAGKNTILMKVWQNTLGWEFCMRIATPDGAPVSFIQKTE